MKILIGIPVYINYPLHLEFTQETISSVKTKHDHEFLIMVNYIDDDMVEYLEMFQYPSEPANQTVLMNKKGNNLSASWNMALKHGISQGFDYTIIPNNDIIFKSDCIDSLVDFAQEHPDAGMWTAAEHTSQFDLEEQKSSGEFDEHPHFSCFMMSPKSVERLGESEIGTKEPYPGFFDENLEPAYFEDGDMHTRIIRAGMKALKTGSAWFYHYGSRTIKVDDELSKINYHTYEKNRNYFRDKWGWDPHNQVMANDDPARFAYKEPFTP